MFDEVNITANIGFFKSQGREILDLFGVHIWLQNIRHNHISRFGLIGFDDRSYNPWQSQTGAVQRVNHFGFSVLFFKTQLHSSCLKRSEIGA